MPGRLDQKTLAALGRISTNNSDYGDKSLGSVLLKVRSGLLNAGKEAVVDPVLRGGQALSRIQDNNINKRSALDGVNVGQVAGDALATGLNFVPAGKVLDVAKGGSKLLTGAIAAKTGRAAATAKPAATALEDAVLSTAKAPKTGLAAKVRQRGNQALADQYGTISKPVARSNDLIGTVSKLADYGVVKPDDAERIASRITGGDGILTKAVRSATGSAARVPTDGLTRIVDDALDNNGVVDSSRKSISSFVKAQMNKLAGGAKGSLQTGADPNDVMDVMRATEDLIRTKLGKGGTYHLPTSDDKVQAKVLGAFRDQLEEGLYKTADANGQVSKVLTPQLREELVSLHPNNAQWAKHIDDTVMNSKTVGELRGAMKPFVNISKVIDDASISAQTAGGKISNQLTKTGMAKAALESAPVQRMVGTTLRAVSGAKPTGGGSALKTAAEFVTSPGRAGAVLRKTPGAAFTTAGNAALNTELPGKAPADVQAPLPTPEAADAALQDGVTPDDGSVFTPEVLRAMAVNDIETTGGKNLERIATLKKLFGSETAKPANSAVATRISDGNSALAGLDKLAGMIQAGKGSVGPISGRVRTANPYDTDEQTLRAELDTTRQIVAKALEGGKLTDADAERYKKILPTTTDTKQVALAKIQSLQQSLRAKMQEFSGLVGSGSSTDSLDDLLAG